MASPPGSRRPPRADWQQETYRALRQNALRMLIATSPDFQTS